MILDWEKMRLPSGTGIDANRTPVPDYTHWIDTETGECRYYVKGENGKPRIDICGKRIESSSCQLVPPVVITFNVDDQDQFWEFLREPTATTQSSPSPKHP